MPIFKQPAMPAFNASFMSAEGVDSSKGDFLEFTSSRSTNALSNTGHQHANNMGCLSCEEGRLKTLYGISDPTDYELSQNDKYISEELGGNAVFMSGYPGVTGLMGARPPSSFQFTRLNPAKRNLSVKAESSTVDSLSKLISSKPVFLGLLVAGFGVGYHFGKKSR